MQARMDAVCRMIIEATIIKLVLLLRALYAKFREVGIEVVRRMNSARVKNVDLNVNTTATIQEAIG